MSFIISQKRYSHEKAIYFPAFRAFDIHAEQVLAMSITIDGGQHAEQWTQQKGWNCEDWMGGDDSEEDSY